MSVPTDYRVAGQWPYILLPATFVIFTSSYLLYAYGVAPAVVGFSLNPVLNLLGQLIIGTFAAYLVVIFVAELGNRREQEIQQRRQTTALTQISQPVNDHLALLSAWYVAAAEPPIEQPESYQAAFDEQYTQTVSNLDFLKPYDVGAVDTDTWLARSATELTEFRRELLLLVDLYSESLDSDVVEQLYNLANSRLTKQLITVHESGMYTNTTQDETFALFSDDSNARALQAHLEVLQETLETLDEHEITDEQIELDDCWQQDSLPNAGSARVAPDSNATQQYSKVF